MNSSRCYNITSDERISSRSLRNLIPFTSPPALSHGRCASEIQAKKKLDKASSGVQLPPPSPHAQTYISPLLRDMRCASEVSGEVSCSEPLGEDPTEELRGAFLQDAN